MKSSDDCKKHVLYDRLFKSIDETFKESVIPENERICFCIDMDQDAVQKQFDAHKARCREKYGTDEGVSLFSANFLGEEEAKELRLEAESKKIF